MGIASVYFGLLLCLLPLYVLIHSCLFVFVKFGVACLWCVGLVLIGFDFMFGVYCGICCVCFEAFVFVLRLNCGYCLFMRFVCV